MIANGGREVKDWYLFTSTLLKRAIPLYLLIKMSKQPTPNNNDTDFEIRFYENILKESPDFIETMMALADLYTKKGLYREGLELDERLARLRPEEPIIFYNLACSYSLLNDQYAALNAIKKAIELGYDDFDHLYSDSDLANLMADEEFRKYLKNIQKKQKSSKASLPKKE